MKENSVDKLIAYLALFSGITISAVAEYYSILGLMAIFSAAVLPIIIMGIALGIGKVTATVWLKQNWNYCPIGVKVYLSSAIAILMLITSMGIFGFLSKAHSDQNLVSGDVLAKIAIYDEKIKTEKENIDANRKAIKQLDDAVEQIMGRSADEKGAEKAVLVRKSQQEERKRLLGEISKSQQTIVGLNNERAPIAGEVRKVEAEVGPIKYIAAFVYGNTEPAILERAVTWVILIIIFVFDPLAVMLLLASQNTFQNLRKEEGNSPSGPAVVNDRTPTVTQSDVSERKSDEFSLPEVKETLPMPPVIVPREDPELEEMIEHVKKGKMPFYAIPDHLKDQVKQRLQDDSQSNTNNPA